MRDLLPLFKTLSDEKRITIVSFLLEREHCVCELIDKLALSQSTVSHHIKVLKQAGLLNERRRGTWSYYSLRKEGFAEYGSALEERLFKPVARSSFKECPRLNKGC